MRGQKTLFSRDSDEWGTPAAWFKKWSDEVGGFTLDPCATKRNAKAKKYFTKKQDGLAQPWSGKVFVNPPYSKIKDWCKKCFDEHSNCELIYLLVPARTDTKWFHEFIWNGERHRPHYWNDVRFIKGRLKFEGGESCAPFPSMLVIFKS